jgi:hypothetical protein
VAALALLPPKIAIAIAHSPLLEERAWACWTTATASPLRKMDYKMPPLLLLLLLEAEADKWARFPPKVGCFLLEMVGKTPRRRFPGQKTARFRVAKLLLKMATTTTRLSRHQQMEASSSRPVVENSIKMVVAECSPQQGLLFIVSTFLSHEKGSPEKSKKNESKKEDFINFIQTFHFSKNLFETKPLKKMLKQISDAFSRIKLQAANLTKMLLSAK